MLSPLPFNMLFDETLEIGFDRLSEVDVILKDIVELDEETARGTETRKHLGNVFQERCGEHLIPTTRQGSWSPATAWRGR